MPLSASILSYEDIRRLLDQALASERGIRVTRDSKNDAIHFRQRIYKFRALDRARNSKIYPDPSDPMHGASVYDTLVATLAGENQIEIRLMENIPMQVEEL